jgi:FtsH-binding integral membrane protein
MQSQTFGGFDSFQRPINWSALGKMGEISPRVQQHLLKVYATLSTGILAAAIGAYIDHKFFVAGVVTQLALFAAVIGLNFIHDTMNRLVIFSATGLLMGINLGPLLEAAAVVAPEAIVTALMGTALIFASFSAAALFAKRRSLLFIGGICGSFLSMMISLRFLNFVFGGYLSSGLFEMQLYGGLAMFMGYVIFDTQMIIEEASQPSHLQRKDFVSHALELLIDFVGIFVRLLVILMRNADKQKRRDEERRNRHSR